VPNRCVPRASTLTSRRVLGSVPIVRYFMRGFLSVQLACPRAEHESGCLTAL
jgi:hypothetical protein